MSGTFGNETFNPEEHPHQRYNPLTDEWVLVSPHRCNRPWSGQTEKVPGTAESDRCQQEECERRPALSPSSSNPLCPGVERASGKVNPLYTSTHVFTNDYPALLDLSPSVNTSDDPLFQCAPARGTCRVMCFHPQSALTIPLMTADEVAAVVDRWAEQVSELGRIYSWVQIFENRGAAMGCSNSHPHCQIWASHFVPDKVRRIDRQMRRYCQQYGRPLLLDYVRRELQNQVRVVCKNSAFVVLVPYWAVWPYETIVLPQRHVLRLDQLSSEERTQLAGILQQLTAKYDNLFSCDFPYSMGWYGAPTGEFAQSDQSHWLLHAVYLPPLLRSASVKKFMVGYEMLAQPQRDITAEKAAEMLRNCSSIHYKLK